MSTYAILSLVLVIVAIILGWKWNINIGATALMFAYIVGTFMMGIKPSVLRGYFPVNMVFTLSTVTFFYGFAAQNGTMTWLAQKVTHASAKHPIASPIVVFFAELVLGMISGPDSAVVFMGPILYGVAREMGLSLTYTTVLIASGCSAGGLFLYGQGGAVIAGIMEGLGLAEDVITSYGWVICLAEIVVFFIIFMGAYFIFKVYKVKEYNYKEPEPLNRQQKLTLTLIFIEMLYIFVPLLLNIFLKNDALKAWTGKFNIAFICASFGVIASILKCGDGKRIVKTFIPWSTIFMLIGVTILMGVATEAGMVDLLAGLLASLNNKHVIFLVLGLIAAIMSCFSGATTVVCPMLFPVALELYPKIGLKSPVMLLACIAVCAMTTGSTSPFSTGGALVISTPGADLQDEVFKKMIKIFVISVPVAAFLFFLASFLV